MCAKTLRVWIVPIFAVNQHKSIFQESSAFSLLTDNKDPGLTPCIQPPKSSAFCQPQSPSVHNRQSPVTKMKPSLSDDAHVPSVSVIKTDSKHSGNQERTVLLNATMEMTLAKDTEIVTVESKAKEMSHSGKLKCRKGKKQTRRSVEAVKSSVDPMLRDTATAPTEVLLQADNQLQEANRGTKVKEREPSKTQCKSGIPSYIPRLGKSKTGSCEAVSAELTDFTDRDITFSKPRQSIALLSEHEEHRPKITYRRSKTKGKRVSALAENNSVTVPLQLHEDKSNQSILEQVCGEVEEVSFGSKQQRHLKSTGMSHKSRCRATFVIADTSDCPSSQKECATEELLMPSVGPPTCDAAEPSNRRRVSDDQECLTSNPHEHREGHLVQETQSSCKRSWLGTNSGTLLENSNSSAVEFQNRKKARAKITSRSIKKAATQEEEWVEESSDPKKMLINDKSAKGLRPEDERSVEGHVNSSEKDDEHVDALLSDNSGKENLSNDLCNSKRKKSPKHCRSQSRLHTPSELRDPRKTFVVWRRKTQARLNDTETFDASSACSYMEDTSDGIALENQESLLIDEVPPWLAEKVTTDDTVIGSMLATPAGRTSHKPVEDSPAVTAEASGGNVTHHKYAFES